MGDFGLTGIVGIICKLLGSTALAARFILIKYLDVIYDNMREEDHTLDQHDWKRMAELLKDDVYYPGRFLAKYIPLEIVREFSMHKLDILQYCLIPVYAAFDVAALFWLSFAMFGSLQVFSIVIYQFMLVYIIEDVVDWNEKLSVLSLTITSVLVSVFAPTEDDVVSREHTWDPANFNTSFWSIAWLGLLCILKVYSFEHLRRKIKYHIHLKDEEKLKDTYQPRPLSWYNMLGPLHLATTGALFIIIVKFILNLTKKDASAGIIGSIFAFVFVGCGCNLGAAHGYHDIIYELHSATVFPCFVLAQSALAILSGIINFCEYPDNQVAFWVSYIVFIFCIVIFVIVMEVNEPKDQYIYKDTELASGAGENEPYKGTQI